MKKNTNDIIAINQNFDLEATLQSHTNVSLRKLALASETTYGLLLKAARKPVEGQPYDPTSINYQAVTEYFDRREINLADLDWDQMNTATAVSRESQISKDLSSYAVNSEWYLREDNETPFVVIYTTETHIVIIKKGTQEPHAMSFNTFLAKGPMQNKREC